MLLILHNLFVDNTKDPTVYYTCEDTDDWFSELNYRGSEAFFFNIACMNILYHKPFTSAANIPKAKYNDEISNKNSFCTFTDDDTINNGYQRRGFLDKSGKILGCYWNLIGRIFVSADSKEELYEFANSTDIKFKPFSFKSVKKTEKKKKLPKVDSNIMTEYYEKLLSFLPDIPEKLDKNKILKNGGELGVKLPRQLVDFYRYFGSSDKFLDSFFIFKKLEDIHVENNVLVFGATNEYYSYLGIDLDCMYCDEPYVTEYSDNKCSDIIDSYGASAFFFNAACFQIMNIMQAMAVVNISKKYFFSKILDKKKVFSFYDDKQLKKGYYISACHNEDFSVLCCYVDDVLYAAANDDDILNDFEKKTKWELDWL